MKYKGVIFDLDGTLLDTKQDLCDCFNRAAARYGFPGHTPDDFILCVGWGTRRMIKLALPAAATEEEANAVFAAHQENYSKGLLNRTKPFPGFHETLRALAGGGLALAVLSNKPDVQTQALIETLLGDIPFRVIFGQREGKPVKPDPGVPLEIAALMGLDPAEVAFVGDSDVDMETARNAGMYPVGVTWGYRERELIRKAGARFLADKPEDLTTLLLKPE